MMIRLLCAVTLMFIPAFAAAQGAADLSRVLRLPELAQILSEEARRTGQDIDTDMLAGEGGNVFAAQIEAINAPDRLADQIATALEASLSTDDQARLIGFWDSAQGAQVIELETAARRAFLDPEIEEFAKARVEDSPHLDAIARMIDAGDMITQNRETATSTTAAFYFGMREGGALDLSDGQIDDLAREQASGGDADTRDWLTAFLSLAYSPLSEDETEVLATFWETDLGLRFSDALFDAFDLAYTERWYAMGQAAALFLSAEDI